MTRATMRALLRRRLQEETARDWTDSDLNTLLGLGLEELEKKILALNPDAFLFIDQADIVSGQEFYEKPLGWITVVDVQVKGSDGEYATLGDPILYTEHLAGIISSSGVRWFDFGTHFGLSPKPDVSVVDGIQCVWVPSLAMAVDSDVPVANQNLHMAIVLYAEHFAMGETGEAALSKDPTLANYINSIPQFYLPRSRSVGWRPGVDRSYS